MPFAGTFAPDVRPSLLAVKALRLFAAGSCTRSSRGRDGNNNKCEKQVPGERGSLATALESSDSSSHLPLSIGSKLL